MKATYDVPERVWNRYEITVADDCEQKFKEIMAECDNNPWDAMHKHPDVILDVTLEDAFLDCVETYYDSGELDY